MNLCKYKDIFGKPNEGVHSIRFLNIAIVDLSMTIIFSYIFHYLFGLDVFINYLYFLIITLIIGIVVHRLFCVNTTINKIIFGYIKNDVV
jgi:hypothetical protein